METNASHVGLGASLMQVRARMWFSWNETPSNAALWPITFTNHSLASAETCYSNIERAALDILHGLEKCHHYCFASEVNVITDPKPPVAVFKNTTMDTPVQHQKTIQTRVITIHHSLAIQTWLWNKEKPGMCITIYTIESCTDTPEYITAEVREGTLHHYLCRACTLWLAIHKNWGTIRTATLLVIQGQDGNYRQDCHQRNTYVATREGNK